MSPGEVDSKSSPSRPPYQIGPKMVISSRYPAPLLAVAVLTIGACAPEPLGGYAEAKAYGSGTQLAADAGGQLDYEPEPEPEPEPVAQHRPPAGEPEAHTEVGLDEDAGAGECGWEDTGDRSIVWCDGEDYFCCTNPELDGPRGHWRSKVCPGFCELGFVAMEDFHIIGGGGTYRQALYFVEDLGQCDV